MKKIIFILLSTIICITFLGCGNISDDISKYYDKVTSTNEDNTTNENIVSQDLNSRPMKNGFDKNTARIVVSGNYIIPIPDYYEENSSEKYNADYIGYAETSKKVAMITISSLTDDSDPVTFKTLYNDRDNLISMIENWSNDDMSYKVISYDTYTTAEFKGIIFNFNFIDKESNLEGTGKYLVFPSKKDSKWIYISLSTTNNTEYCYDDDFERMISAIEKRRKNTITEKEPTSTPKSEEPISVSNDIRPEFKEALDSYEDFFDKYCEIIKLYSENPSDMDLLKKYTEYMGKYATVMQKMNSLDDGELSEAELAYYMEVTTRITKKLLAVAQ